MINLRKMFPLLIFVLLLIFMVGCTVRIIQSEPGVYHQVKKGEYLWRIAKTYKVDMEAIMRANRISNPNKLWAGQRLFIPGVQESLRVKRSYSTPPVSLAKGAFIWPVSSRRITSKYGIRKGKPHHGLDIGSPKGSKIIAAQSGTVAYAGTLSGYGKVIIIDHNNGYSTVYAHNSKNLVKVDEKVKQGQTIGKVGSTGRSTGPHLHFEIRKGYQAVNPLKYLS